VPSIKKPRYEVKNKLMVKDSGRDLELGGLPAIWAGRCACWSRVCREPSADGRGYSEDSLDNVPPSVGWEMGTWP
jgi:hypothetical protein